jgi:hypothetical protein
VIDKRSMGIAILAIVAAFLAPPAWADVKPKLTELGGEPAQSLLWVGNSFFFFNNGIHRHIGGISNAAGRQGRLRNTMVTISGAGIDWHDLDSYLKPGGRMGGYSFVGDNEVVFNKPGRQYDVAIVMDCSQCPIHPKLKGIFQEFARKDAEVARKYGTRLVLFMSWAYKDVPAMTAQLADAYTTEANANDAFVIPAGLAFAKSVSRRPELELYQTDKRHPTLAGSYLAAATSFAALTGKSPVGNSYDPGIGMDTVTFLQNVAWDTVREYFGK